MEHYSCKVIELIPVITREVIKIKQTEKYVKCKVRIKQRIYPHPRQPLFSGDWAIISFYVIEMLEGDIQLKKDDTAIFKGVVCNIKEGEEYTILAEEVEDPTYKTQYEIKYIGQPANLSSIVDQKKFLSRILTSTQVESLYNMFDDPFQIIQDGNIEELCKVKGVGVPTAEKIIQKVMSSVDYSQAYVELDNYGLTNNMIEKLVAFYHSPEIVIQKIVDNPYILADEVNGIGFKKADGIALANGCLENDPKRLFYLAQFVLNNYANEGYSYLSAYDFMYYVEEIVDDLDSKAFGQVIKDNENTFYVFDFEGERYIALRDVYDLEDNIAKDLVRIKKSDNEFEYKGWEDAIKKLEVQQGWEYTDEQKAAIEALFKYQVLVVTGFGGTGKTSTVAAMIEVLNGYSFAQTALSGRASSRMQEITGEEGYTIHRLLGYNPKLGYTHNKNNMLTSDIIIVDEVSMIGGDIFYRLIQAIKDGAKLVLLGDVGQLESIGVMNILHDLISGDVIKSCHLTKPHRQAMKSGGITSGIMVRNGEQLFDDKFEGKLVTGELEDCVFDVTHNKKDIPDMIQEYFEMELENGTDILQLQVLTPKNKGSDLSCMTLNNRLQEVYNPMKDDQSYITLVDNKIEYEIRVGDKVINRKNNYKTINDYGMVTPIFNGDIGIVNSIDMESKSIMVDFVGKGIIYISKTALSGVKLGYCITTHSFQGSQAEVIIYGLDYSAYKLLNREQVYTALSRMKLRSWICTENKAMRFAISTSEIRFKQTFLPSLLVKHDREN